MGIDIYYQALPGDGRLLQRALEEAEFGALMSFLSYGMRNANLPLGGVPYGHSATDLDFLQEVNALIAENPGIVGRRYDLYDRSWDALHYLLSEARRGKIVKPISFDLTDSSESEKLTVRSPRKKEKWSRNSVAVDWGTSAIRGERALKLDGGQGQAMRYSSSEVVQDSAEYLALLEWEDVVPYYDPEAMWEASVYKSGGLAEEPDGLERLWGNLMELKTFYGEVAAHKEGVLVILY